MTAHRFESETDPEFLRVTQLLQAHGLAYTLPTQFQIKIGKYNYYWTTEKITHDLAGKVVQHGIDALIGLLTLEGEPPRKTFKLIETSRATKPRPIDIFKVTKLSLVDSNMPPPWD